MNIPNIAGESQEGNIDRKAYNPSHIAPPLDVTFSFSSLIAVLDSDVTRPSSSSHHKIIKFKTQKNYTYERTKDLRFIRFAALLRHGNNHTMFTLKNKVTEKLSHLFADAPTSPSSSSLPSPLDDNNHRPEARPFSKGGKSLSSYFSLPSVVFGGSRSNKHQSIIVSNGDFESQDESVHRYVECRSPPGENNEKENNRENDVDCASGGSTSGSEVFEEAADQHSLQKQLPLLMDDSVFISSDLHEFLLSSLPNIVKGCQWVLLYSTSKHGISLRTLIRKSAELSGPCLLVVGDRQGAVFGGLLEGPLKPTAKRKYQGTNQTFVFTTVYGEPRLFRPTGANRYYCMCLNDMLALGGGGNYALCLDGDLLSGTSGPCETFGNLCLGHDAEFELKNVELWGFTHASRYLT